MGSTKQEGCLFSEELLCQPSYTNVPVMGIVCMLGCCAVGVVAVVCSSYTLQLQVGQHGCCLATSALAQRVGACWYSKAA